MPTKTQNKPKQRQKNQNTNHVLALLTDKLGVGVAQFEKKINVKPTRVAATIYQNRTPPLDLIYHILEEYPTVNKAWLETGKGDMFIEPVKTPELPEPTIVPTETQQASNAPSDYVRLLEQTLEEYRAREKNLFMVIDALRK